MNKKGILFLLGLFLFLGYISQNNGSGIKTAKAYSTSSDWCYQETATTATSCGGLSSGIYACSGNWAVSYPCTNIYDGNWGTYGYANNPGSAILYINYTKPTNALPSSLWIIKDSQYDAPNGLNWTISSECWAQTPLRFRIDSNLISGQLISHSYHCWSGSSWSMLINQTDSPIYEEAMWWNIAQPTGNWKANIQIVGPNRIKYNTQLKATTPSELLDKIISWFTSTILR